MKPSLEARERLAGLVARRQPVLPIPRRGTGDPFGEIDARFESEQLACFGDVDAALVDLALTPLLEPNSSGRTGRPLNDRGQLRDRRFHARRELEDLPRCSLRE